MWEGVSWGVGVLFHMDIRQCGRMCSLGLGSCSTGTLVSVGGCALEGVGVPFHRDVRRCGRVCPGGGWGPVPHGHSSVWEGVFWRGGEGGWGPVPQGRSSVWEIPKRCRWLSSLRWPVRSRKRVGSSGASISKLVDGVDLTAGNPPLEIQPAS